MNFFVNFKICYIIKRLLCGNTSYFFKCALTFIKQFDFFIVWKFKTNNNQSIVKYFVPLILFSLIHLTHIITTTYNHGWSFEIFLKVKSHNKINYTFCYYFSSWIQFRYNIGNIGIVIHIFIQMRIYFLYEWWRESTLCIFK